MENLELKQGLKVILGDNFGPHPRGLKGEINSVEYDEDGQVKFLYIIWNGFNREEQFYFDESPNISDYLQIVVE